MKKGTDDSGFLLFLSGAGEKQLSRKVSGPITKFIKGDEILFQKVSKFNSEANILRLSSLPHNTIKLVFPGKTI